MSSNPQGCAIALQRIAHEAKARTGALDLRMLGLTELPEELFALTHLRELNLGGLNYREEKARRESGALVSANELKSALGKLTVFGELQTLSVSRTDIIDLAWARQLRGLQSLDCSDTQVNDLAPLRGLTALQSLACSDTQVSDLAPLEGLFVLRSLDCARTQVSDLTPLKSLPALQSLDCAGTRVSDLAPLKGLPALQSLDCSKTQVSDLAPLKGLTALQSLGCSRTQVSDLAPLKGLTALQQLICSDTQVSDLAPLKGLSALQSLICSDTQVNDLAPLRGLTALQQLICSDTQVSDLAPLQGLTALQSLICYQTLVSDLAPLRGLPALLLLYCSNTDVSDLAPVKSLTALQSLNCSWTQARDLAPLVGLAKLERLTCNGLKLSDEGRWCGRIVVQTRGGQARELLSRLCQLVERQQNRIGLEAVRSAPKIPAPEEARSETTLLAFGSERSPTPRFYVSYAWADPTDPDREKIVDQACEEAEKRGTPIIRDKTALSFGDSIAKFMRAIGEGDRIFVVLSDKYLKSPFCMFELFEIWRNSRQDKAEFLRRVRIYTLGDAKIRKPVDRVRYGKYWSLLQNSISATRFAFIRRCERPRLRPARAGTA